MKKTKENRAITLVALIVTIIILLILAGISVSVLTQTGLFEKAIQAKEKSDDAKKQENTTLSKYNDILNEYDENTLAYKVKNGIVKIGDYVKYTPNTVTSTDKSYTDLISDLGTYSGSNENTTSSLTQEINKDTGLNWRVLDVKDGQVRLISDKPTTSTITLAGYNGYNNAVKLLDDTCKTLYNNVELVSDVQNLKKEDIQDKLIEKDITNFDNNYGKVFKTSSTYYPSILAQEKGQKIDGIEKEELVASEQTNLINQQEKLKANTLEVKYTYWNKEINKNDFLNSIYYTIFINNGSNYETYWLSSRCVYTDSSYARYNIDRVFDGSIGAGGLSYSGGGYKTISHSLRPIIILNSNIQIDTANSGDGSTATQGYAIK